MVHQHFSVYKQALLDEIPRGAALFHLCTVMTDMEFTLSNTSLRNTQIHAPNGSILYTIMSETHFFHADNTTVSRVVDGQLVEIVKFEWHDASGKDVMMMRGSGKMLVKDYLLPKGTFSSSRAFPTPNGEWTWKLDGPVVHDPSGNVLARYQKNERLFGSNKSATGAPASLFVSPEASQRLDDVVFGLLVMHKERQRQDNATSAGVAGGLAASGAM